MEPSPRSMRNSVGKRLRCLVQECYGHLKIVCDVFGGLAGTDAGARRLNGHSVAHEEGTAESNVRIDFEEIGFRKLESCCPAIIAVGDALEIVANNFPEYALTGYELGEPGELAAARGFVVGIQQLCTVRVEGPLG